MTSPTTLSTAPYAEPLYLTRPTSSPYYTPSHHRLQREVRRYVSEHITPYCTEWESQGSVPDDTMARHAQLGYAAVSIYPLDLDTLRETGQRLPGDIRPEDWDGFHDLIVIDEIARCGYLGVIWGLSCGNAVGVPPLINYGTREQRRRFLPDVMKGRKRFCLGITEPDAGSDVAGIKTTAERHGSHYIVNGDKKWITNGIWADYMTAAVRTGPEGSGRAGISALIIDMHSPGVTTRKLENSGVASSGSTYVEFEDVKVPAENLIGPENGGFEIIMSNFNHERIWLAGTALRLARVSAHDAYEYATVRETFGKPLIENQVIAAKVAGFGRVIEPVWSFLESVVYMAERQRLRKKNKDTAGQGGAVLAKNGQAVQNRQDPDFNLGGLVAQVKVAAGRALEAVNRDAQQILGGAGYQRSGKGVRIEQISRDVRILCVGGGSEEVLQELSFKLEVKELQRLVQQADGGGEDSRSSKL